MQLLSKKPETEEEKALIDKYLQTDNGPYKKNKIIRINLRNLRVFRHNPDMIVLMHEGFWRILWIVR